MDEEGCSAFHRLCSDRRLLRTRSEICFWSAVFEGHHETQRQRVTATVKALLKLDLDPDRVTKPQDYLSGLTPLMLAVRAGDTIAVEVLLEYGCNSNVRNECNENALHAMRTLIWQDRDSNDKITDCLLQSGIDIECRTDSGWTPLIVAARSGDLRIVDKLLDRGADILDRLLPNNDERLEYRSWASFLCRDHAQIPMDEWDAQVACFMHNRFMKLKVHFAAKMGMPKCVNCFLLSGCDVDSRRTNESSRRNENGDRESYEYTTTALDEAYRGKERAEIRERKTLSETAFDEMMQRYEEVIRLLNGKAI